MYGSMEKKIIFQDSDKRHADLRIRLRHDGLTQAGFFKSIVTGYLEGDHRIIDFITEVKIKIAKQGKRRIRKTKKLLDGGKETERLFNLTETEEKDLFDMIEREFPDL